MAEMTLCEIIKGGRILLKEGTRGVSKGKWNGLGGRIEDGETALDCVIREVREESGLEIKNPKKHGTIVFYQGNRKKLFAVVHLFSTSRFKGKIRDSDEGRLKWFDSNRIPYDRMWDDDIFWLPLIMKGKRFDAEFVFDERMEKVRECSIRNMG